MAAVSGIVDLSLEANDEWVKIVIKDNGKGMPQHVIDKIIKKTPITAGKKSGHGIGLTQVWETLERNHGDLTIDSKLNIGTTITLTFPRAKTPPWIAEEITLGNDDIVIILDDDNSIHGAWRTRFEPILKKSTNIKLNHFQLGKEALEFLNTLTAKEKDHSFLLTDYELLKQELNGLHIVAESKIKRSILVTSHYANSLVQNQAAKLGTKILPKQLASEIPIRVLTNDQGETTAKKAMQIKAVIVDDDKAFVNNLLLFVFDEQSTEQYNDPEYFLANIDKYPLSTKIFLDNNYNSSKLKGLDIAAELHQRGYTHLYLLSGETFNDGEIPDYLTLIRKDNIESLNNL